MTLQQRIADHLHAALDMLAATNVMIPDGDRDDRRRPVAERRGRRARLPGYSMWWRGMLLAGPRPARH
jgi:hypothetical protein